jgi:hypothetical protein
VLVLVLAIWAVVGGIIEFAAGFSAGETAGTTAWRVRQALTGERLGGVAGVRGPGCGGCGLERNSRLTVSHNMLPGRASLESRQRWR